MTIDDKIRNEKLQYDIDRKAARIPALSSKKIDKYEYLTGQEILPFNQRQIIEPATFTYSVLGKAFKRQTKTIEDQGENQIKAIEDHGKQLVESNELVKKDFNINRDDLPLEEQKKFNEFVEEKSYEFQNSKNKINPYIYNIYLIYK